MIRLLVLDVDGVLTDGGLYYGPAGESLKRFDVRDGLGIRMLQKAGVTVAIVSGRGSDALAARAADLDITELHMAVGEKGEVLAGIADRLGLAREAIAAMGDDLPDLPLFAGAGLRIAPADAEPELLAAADYVTARRGGRGAVRDAAHHILALNGAKQPPAALARTHG